MGFIFVIELLAAKIANFIVGDFFGGVEDGDVVDGQPVCEEVGQIFFIFPDIIIPLMLIISGQDGLGVV